MPRKKQAPAMPRKKQGRNQTKVQVEVRNIFVPGFVVASRPSHEEVIRRSVRPILDKLFEGLPKDRPVPSSVLLERIEKMRQQPNGQKNADAIPKEEQMPPLVEVKTEKNSE
jgi:hypothetical protein